MGFQHLLVSDIDGTLLRDGQATPGLKALKRLFQTHSDTVALVYATGRSIASTLRLVEKGILPPPQAIAPFVGTEVWLPGWYPSREYSRMLEQGWHPIRIQRLIREKLALRTQEARFQSYFKLSYFLEDATLLPQLKALLQQHRLQAKIVYSCGEYLDIIPVRAGKASAVRFLCTRWQIEHQNVLACGDSGNDVDMLTVPDTCNVAVGNLEEELQTLAGSGRFYVAELPYAGGVLEGAAAFDFWPPTEERTDTATP
ncbi:MAG: HAD-IIB family hydrolase [Deltaproteobacteria bacterium]|nr:HAD-IIB family hydrolase [Deltaproteobacteria bacterium]